MKHILLLLGLLICPFFLHLTHATHIVGGAINMQCLNPKEPGNYKITVSLYFDDLNGSLGALDNSISITIFRKSDNKRMLDIPINLTDRNPVIYTNPACATLRSLKTSILRYIKIVELLPNTYNDPEGYYIVWERCCRNNDIDNIENAKGAGMVFYVEFPPLIRNGTPFVNSTPVFQQLNGEYVCRNEIFELNYDAVDLDGDVLKYSMVTPYNGFTNPTRTAGQLEGSSNYPPVVWINGSDINNQIPGNPSLTVHPQKGVLNVKASNLGLYVISVLCEEFRNGELIGRVRRDFQFLVVDCANNVPAAHTISLASQPSITEVTFCEGTEVELKGNNPKTDWNYQWQRNGDNIAGATSATLITKEEGEYVVVASFKNVCGKTKTASNTIKIKVTKERTKLQYKGKALVCGSGGQAFQIKVLPYGRSAYSWFFNGDLMTTEKNQILNVVKEGAYFAIVKNLDTDCVSKSDTVYVDIVKNQPTVSLTATSQIENRCEGDSVLLNASNTKGFIYEWKKDNQRFDSTLRANKYIKTSGIYTVSITDSNKCVANSLNISITFYAKPTISLDSISPICLSEKPVPIPINYTPRGGILSGEGIKGQTFDPVVAGLGRHTITYTYKGVVECQNATIKRVISVNKSPHTDLIKDFWIFRGMTYNLNSEAKDAITFRWSPPLYLDNPTVANPTTRPEKTTLYILTTTNEWGCVFTDSTYAQVLQDMVLPNIFTPNNDKDNDIWELKVFEVFADIEVSIYNRWGELVFFSKGYKEPFDGTYKGEKLPTGSYVYAIKPAKDIPIIKGGLTIMY
jgi:gliding motility-associated-like protein